MNKRLIPVIHILDEAQALRNALLCHKHGCGIFLIHHKKRHPVLFNVAAKIHAEIPDLWIGVNALDLSTKEVFKKAPEWVNAIWTDDGGIDEVNGQIDATRACIWGQSWRSGIEPEHFGGVAFKYQKPVKNFGSIACAAAAYLDVVTTSGEGTGIAADVNKIRAMKEGIMCHPCGFGVRLAVASGITPENVKDYLPYVDDFLVATGISKDEYNFDEEKLEDLCVKIAIG